MLVYGEYIEKELDEELENLSSSLGSITYWMCGLGFII